MASDFIGMTLARSRDYFIAAQIFLLTNYTTVALPVESTSLRSSIF
jgi:hypothetical protein